MKSSSRVDLFQAAIDVLTPENYIYLDHDPDPIACNKDNPENILERKQKYDSLSEEAVFVISLIFESPREFKACLIKPELQSKGVIKTISKSLKEIGWTWKKIDRAKNEIKTFLKSP